MSLASIARLNVGGRIYAGFALVILVMGCAVGAAVLGLRGGIADFSAYTPVAANSTLAVTVEREFLETRRLVRTFLANATDESAQQVKDQSQKALDGIEDLIPQITNPDRRKMLEAAREQIVAYVGKLEEMIARKLNILTLRKEQMDGAGRQMVELLTAGHDRAVAATNLVLADKISGAIQAIMVYRLDITRSIDRNIPEATDAIAADRAAIEAALAAAEQVSGSDDALITKVKETLQKYADVSAQVVSENAGVVELVDEVMAALGRETTDAITAYVSQAGQAMKDLEDETNAKLQASWISSLTVAAIAVLLGLAISWLVARSIVKPVTAMTGAMGQLAGGDKTTEIPARERSDEVGRMAVAVQVFKDNMIEADRLRAEQEEQKKRAEVERRQGMLNLADKFEASVGNVVKAVTAAATELQATAQSLSATAEEASQQSNAVAAAAEEMTLNVQTVSAATEELSASIREISNQVTESTRIVGSAVSQADDTNSKVKALSEAAQKIGDVVTLINEIAAQTNLLALNATIEAARAGEAGKGFAVVASEVKNLATQTAKATDEIAGQVRSIQDATGTSAQAIESIAVTINRVSEISTAIASAVEEQGAATQEIARNVQEASTGASEVTSNIVGVTQASQQTSAGSAQVLSAASELAKNGETLRREVDTFLATVRAA